MRADASQARVEAVLNELSALPTLSPIAVRLLELTADEDAEAPEIVRLIESDPALSTKVLRLCRRHARGRASNVPTVERAVLLLGFDAVRSAVLSVQIFDVLDKRNETGAARPASHAFDRESFWHHSLAVAVLSQGLASRGGLAERIDTGQAFIAGLLHDLGLLALHVLLPETVDRVCQLAETQGVRLDTACRRFIGLDTRAAGRRVAEHWGLPAPLTDVMWLHGQPVDALPDLPHRDLIVLVTLADAVARTCYVVPAGHGPRGERIDELIEQAGLSRADVDAITEDLHDRVSERARILGLDADRGSDLLLRAISRANAALGRIIEQTHHRAALSDQQRSLLEAITAFHDQPGSVSVVGVWSRMVQSAAELFGGRAFAGVYQLVPGDLWQLVEVTDDGRVVGHRVVEEGSGSDAFERLAVADQRFVPVAHLLDEIEIDPPLDHFGDEVRAIGLDCGWGVSAVILVDDPDHRDIPPEALEPVLQTWSAALAAAARHESAKRLTEQLAEANHELLEAQQELTRRQTLARVGAIAAGAAHEMNNPLTVIAGRSQLLAQRLTEPSARQAAEQIAEQAHRLSDLISALMRFASPAVPRLGSVDAGALARSAAEAVTLGAPHVTVEVNVSPEVPTIFADPEQLGHALEELVRNALESEGTRHIWADVQMDPLDDRLMVQITDDGAGLSEDALTHAFDPFYSAKPAGRQPGLGLAEVQRVVEAHDGRVSLRNGSSGGAVATIWLPIAAAERRVA